MRCSVMAATTTAQPGLDAESKSPRPESKHSDPHASADDDSDPEGSSCSDDALTFDQQIEKARARNREKLLALGIPQTAAQLAAEWKPKKRHRQRKPKAAATEAPRRSTRVTAMPSKAANTGSRKKARTASPPTLLCGVVANNAGALGEPGVQAAGTVSPKITSTNTGNTSSSDAPPAALALALVPTNNPPDAEISA